MFLQLGISVPGDNVKDQIEDDLIVFPWEKALKYRNTTLRAHSVLCLDGNIGRMNPLAGYPRSFLQRASSVQKHSRQTSEWYHVQTSGPDENCGRSKPERTTAFKGTDRASKT